MEEVQLECPSQSWEVRGCGDHRAEEEGKGFDSIAPEREYGLRLFCEQYGCPHERVDCWCLVCMEGELAEFSVVLLGLGCAGGR